MNSPGPALAIHVLAKSGTSVTLSIGYSSWGTMYLDGGIEKVSEPMVILRLGKEGPGMILVLKERRPLRTLFESDSIVPLYALLIAKNESLIKCVNDISEKQGEKSYKGTLIASTPESVRLDVGSVKLTEPKLKDETLRIK